MAKLRIQKNPKTGLYFIADEKGEEHWLNENAVEHCDEGGEGIPTRKQAERELRGIQAHEDCEDFLIERLQALLLEARDRFWVKELDGYSSVYGLAEFALTWLGEEWAPKQRRVA